MRKNVFTMVVLLLTALSCFADVVISPECSTSISSNEYVLHFNMPTYRIENHEVEACSATYSYIYVDANNDETDDIGYPVLPFFTYRLLLPSTYSNLQVQLQINDSDIIQLEYPVIPSLAYSPIVNNSTSDILSPCQSEDYYGLGYDINYQTGYYNDYIRYRVINNNIRTSILYVNIYPFLYRPENSEINVITSCDVLISFSGADILALSDSILNECSTYHNVDAISAIAQYDNFNETILEQEVNYLGGKFLIVAASSSMETYLSQYRNFKQEQLFDTEIIYLDQNGAVGDVSAIESLIYNNSILPNPNFVLFVGSLTEIPPYCGMDDTNDPYSDDPYHPVIGRWIVDGTSELETIIDKSIINQENFINTSTKGILFSSQGDWWQGFQFYNRLLRINNNYFTPLNIPASLFDGRNSSVDFYTLKQALNDQLNPPTMFIYSGHGAIQLNYDGSIWETGLSLPYELFPYLCQGNYHSIQSLNNSDIVKPMGFGFGCSLSSYATADSFARYWLTSESGGVTFYGSTTTSYTISNNSFSNEVFKKYRELIEKIGNFPIGLWLRLAESDYYYSMPTSNRWNQIHKYNLMGDPTFYVFGLPTDGTVPPFHVQSQYRELKSVSVYNINGTLVYRIVDNDESLYLNVVNSLSSGVYIIEFIYEGGAKEVKKIVK